MSMSRSRSMRTRRALALRAARTDYYCACAYAIFSAQMRRVFGVRFARSNLLM
jgi:hypothetical protein